MVHVCSFGVTGKIRPCLSHPRRLVVNKLSMSSKIDAKKKANGTEGGLLGGVLVWDLTLRLIERSTILPGLSLPHTVCLFKLRGRED